MHSNLDFNKLPLVAYQNEGDGALNILVTPKLNLNEPSSALTSINNLTLHPPLPHPTTHCSALQLKST